MCRTTRGFTLGYKQSSLRDAVVSPRPFPRARLVGSWDAVQMRATDIQRRALGEAQCLPARVSPRPIPSPG